MKLLAFLHGLGQMPQTWQDQVTALPPGFKAVAPWLRGTRPGKPEAFDVDAAADEVLGLLNQHGVESMALCGVSLGAVVALNAAIRAPDAVSHLVLAAGQVNPPAGVMRVQRAVMRATPASRFAAVGVSKEKALAAMDVMARLDLRSGLGAVTARTLLVCGERDRANRPATEALHAGIAGSRVAIVPGAGHEVNVEAPAAFNELLYGFLAE